MTTSRSRSSATSWYFSRRFSNVGIESVPLLGGQTVPARSSPLRHIVLENARRPLAYMFYPVARHLARQILLLAETLRLGQRTQRLGPARSLARTLGETSHRRLSPEASVGRIRRLSYMMLAHIAAVSPSSVWRVLHRAGLLRQWNGKQSKKGTGFQQPPEPHQHWHIDVSYLNVSSTFYYLCSVRAGAATAVAIVQWDLREAMREVDVEIILEAAKEKYPQAQPRIISDNGPQFIAKDFKDSFASRHDARENVALLSAIQRQVGALAPVVEERMHSARRAADARGCAAADRALCRALQHGAAAQRDRIRSGYADRSCRPRPETGARSTATVYPSASSLTDRVALPGKTEAGSAGKPCRGIARRAHETMITGAEAPFALGVDRPPAIYTNAERSLSRSG